MLAKSNVIWSGKEAMDATGGRLRGDWSATGVSIDSRTLAGGDLFVALTGEKMDGHDFVRDALDKGAAACVVSRVPEGVDENAPLLIVDDTQKAIEALGAAARARTGADIIAVTGSAGKTTTKEMLACAFGALGQVHASKASYNNLWGVPLSLAGMHEGTDFGIFEIGMNHAGEITPLTKQVRPHIAIITTIAGVHMEHFDSVEQIADAKAEIFNGMDEHGFAVLNRDNEWFDHLKNRAEGKGLRVLSFGSDENADARMTECMEAANGSRIRARIMDEDVHFTLPLPGRHMALNALSVLLAVKLAGQDLQKAAGALQKMEAVAGRGVREYLDIGDPKNPVTLIDESYNASPVAMKAAFKVLALVDPGRGGRRIAVLGDMYELGRNAKQEHADLALPLQAADVQLVYTCGTLMKSLYDALPEEQKGAHREDSVEMAKIVPDVLVPGDVVMVKGSRGGGRIPRMQVIVEALRALPGRRKKKGQTGKDDTHVV